MKASVSAKLAKSQYTSCLVFTKRIKMKCVPPIQSQQKWLKDFNEENEESIKWHETYQLASKCTKSTLD